MRPTPHNAPDGFAMVERLRQWSLADDTLTLSVTTTGRDSATIMLSSPHRNIVRFRFLPPGISRAPRTPIITGNTEPAQPLSAAEDSAGLTISTPYLAVRIDRDPWYIRFLAPNGDAFCRENPADVDGLGRPFVLPLGFVRRNGTITRVIESFHLRPDEHLYGLGEKFTPLDKTRQRVVSWTQDAFGSTGERSHKNIPFLWSTQGYGVLIDTGARITWELGTRSCQSYSIDIEGSSFDAYLIYGPGPAEILASYADLTGHAPVPPKWTFGLWGSSGGTYRDRESVEQLIQGFDDRKIPLDVIHVDPWWMKWRTYCDFRWDEAAFPNPQEFTQNLHRRSLKLCLWEHPYVSVESDLFVTGREKGYFLRRPDGEVYVIDYGLSLAPRPDGAVRTATPENSWNARVAIIDLTNPGAYAWFQDLHRPIFALGADVFKTDFGEDIPADAIFSNGETGATMHNLYPLLYNRAVYEVTQQERGYGVVWSRSGTAGSQRYPVCWSGDPAADFDSLACTIRGGLSAGLSGIPFWSNDIGGYRGKPSKDLYVRWAQFGLFCSHSRMHGDSPREPWIFGNETAQTVRRFVELRYSLFPYLYSTAHEAARTGMPLIRALPLAFPGDPNAHDKDFQYMLGPWILVAPIYDATGKRNVYLPEGEWVDFWSGEVHAGPWNLSIEAPLDTLPLYIRSGAIIPMMSPARRIPEGRLDPLTINVYPSVKSDYTMIEDEGTAEFSCTAGAEEVVVRWKGLHPRRFSFVFHDSRTPESADYALDGQRMTAATFSVTGGTGAIQVPVPSSNKGVMHLTFRPRREQSAP